MMCQNKDILEKSKNKENDLGRSKYVNASHKNTIDEQIVMYLLYSEFACG
jgi:hypothetical protein